MVTEKTLERINELYHKSKAEGLTDAELAEQKQLRAEYVKAFRENLRGQLESIKINKACALVLILKYIRRVINNICKTQIHCMLDIVIKSYLLNLCYSIIYHNLF